MRLITETDGDGVISARFCYSGSDEINRFKIILENLKPHRLPGCPGHWTRSWFKASGRHSTRRP